MKIRTKTSRILPLIMCVAICLALMPATFAAAADEWENPFTDVRESAWYYDAVRYMNILNVFQGTSQTEFSPNGAMTRGMFVTALGRFSGDDVSGYSDSGFADVSPGAYYAPYVAWARYNGYVNGTSEKTFSPNDPITREALATLLYRYISIGFASQEPDKSLVSLTLSFLDKDSISTWAVQGIAEMYYTGIMTGVSDSNNGEHFYPKQSATRAEVATVLMRCDGYLGKPKEIDYSAIAAEFFKALAAGDVDGIEQYLSYLLLDDLETMGGIQAVLDYIGEILGITDITGPIPQGQYMVFTAVVTTENGEFSFVIIFSGDGFIEGISASPGATVEDPIQMPEDFAESAITVDAGEGFPLEGRVVLPKDVSELVPAIVLIQGSGATNYDEIVGANRIFGQVARGLAERGIASLRYSKRNYAYPEIMSQKGYSVYDEYVRDVVAAVELIKQQPGVDPDRVYILGHSQGGMLAPMFLDEGAGAAGMILFAGSPRGLMDILVDQQELAMEYYTAIGENETVEAYRQMQEVWISERQALDSMTAEEALEAGTVYEFPAYYMYVLEHYNAIETIKKLAVPTLILQGGNDLQVYPDRDYVIYKDEVGSEPYVDMKLYEGLNHAFMPSVATNLFEATAEYDIPAGIPDKVFDDIADWIFAGA